MVRDGVGLTHDVSVALLTCRGVVGRRGMPLTMRALSGSGVVPLAIPVVRSRSVSPQVMPHPANPEGKRIVRRLPCWRMEIVFARENDVDIRQSTSRCR